ncbi:hypothetical protein I3760_15G118300 [Carya illinoinensis]|nr:hypothetical protein I3760_15G118300 [Carya illinoinensis]KAG2667503.1 hypothetical protein I3760_15G118300 [Carya illinoinensis]KAG2667504.1 hypothetical protein I3760_15G118300 [Carya illinoinensis]
MGTSSMAFQLGASSSLSFSSCSIPRWTHDVCLSFRGEDVRQNFISHLYHALHQREINTYIDNNLKRGEEISPELFKAIEGSMISIVVLSKNYSDSRWCLDELLKILECKATVKQIHVLPLFYDVPPSDVRHQKGNFGEAFARVEHKFKADKVKLTKWKEALEKVANLSGFELGDRNESDFIRDIITWVESIMKNHPSLNVAKYPVGIESRVRDIYQRLSMERNDIICMVGIFGTGGIGKTTISKDIYNRISNRFEGSCFLKNIRETSKQKKGLIRLQNKLLKDILGGKLDVCDFDEGVNVISHRLHSKRVLLILDDVDELKQLETLAGDPKWFGPGSRIIVTTRDQHLLNISKVDSKYELKILADNEARKLLSLHAFEKDEPLDSYAKVFEQVMQYAQGLPLALTVLGSTLKDQTIGQWESALDKYKQIPNKDIQSVLEVSYDGLEEHEKDMFLDIACFFKGEPAADVYKIFESCHFHPNCGIQKLIDKCLITVIDKIWMHDLLQDMGREIVRKESPKEPGARSRLWFYEDIRYVLEENTGTNNVEGIKVDLPDGHVHDTIRLSPNSFKEMKRLRIFISHNARFSGEFNYLSNELRVLNWSNYHLQDFPSNFCGEKLAVFKMQAGCINKIIGGCQFKNLTIMRFYMCKFLTRIPDLSSCSNLEKLYIESCENVVEIHDSVGLLDKLVGLVLDYCPKLKSFPRRLKLRSLEDLNLMRCSKLQNFPQIECKMERLLSIDLMGTPIKEWPSSSIGYLTPLLNSLSLKRCVHQLQNQNEPCLSDYSIILRHHPWVSNIDGCFNGIKGLYLYGSVKDLVHLLNKIPHLQHLKSLSLTGDPNLAIDEIHSFIGYLTGLQCLHLATYSDEYPMLDTWFYASFSNDCSSTLQELDLCQSGIVRLPPSTKSFVELRVLRMMDCDNLQEILHLPPNIECLLADGCCSLERCPEVSTKFQFYTSCGLQKLSHIGLSICPKLDENIGSQAPNPSFVEEHIQNHSCDIIFPGNKIPDWFSHTKETSNSHSCELDISGPLYLDKIIGIVFCAVFGEVPYGSGAEADIYVSINGSRLVETYLSISKYYDDKDCEHVYLNYTFKESIEEWLQYPTGDNLRFTFEGDDEPNFKSCGVHIIYKHEENESLTVGECSVDSLNGILLSKRRRDDEDINLEFNKHPQHKRRSQNLGNSNVVIDCTCVDSDFAEAEGGSEGSLKEEDVPASRFASQESQGNS